jgi:hypothetical protein
MPEYRVHGASRSSGREKSIVVEAIDQLDAERQVEDRLLISHTETVVSSTTSEPPAPARRMHPPQKPRRGFISAVSNYNIMLVSGVAVAVVGVLAVIIGLVVTAFGVWATIESPLGFTVLLTGVGLLYGGLVNAALGELILSLREVALNTRATRAATEAALHR